MKTALTSLNLLPLADQVLTVAMEMMQMVASLPTLEKRVSTNGTH